MEHDSAWKEVLEKLFEKFLSFFFPNIHKDIDFSRGFEFLDNELQQIAVESESGKRIVDKLVKVYLVDGAEKWLLIHIVKLIDYREHWTELETNPHPFAIIVRAYLKALETVGNVQEKYSWKKRFLLELYQLGMNRETLWAIYKFIDWMIRLPKDLNKAFVAEMKTIEEAKHMSLITSAEEVGLEQGINSLQRVIATIIKRKFGALGQQLAERTHKVNRLEILEKLSEKLLDAQSISEAERFFDEIELSTE